MVLLRHLLLRSLFFHHISTHQERCIALQSLVTSLSKQMEALGEVQAGVDRDKLQSFLQQVRLPPGTSLDELNEQFRVTGLANPFTELYWREKEFSQLPYVLFLTCVEAAQQSQ